MAKETQTTETGNAGGGVVGRGAACYAAHLDRIERTLDRARLLYENGHRDASVDALCDIISLCMAAENAPD